MKKLLLLAALAGAVGCTTTTAERQWTADEPPPLATGTRPVAASTPEGDPSKLPAAQTRVSAEDIDDQNYQEQARKLESELKVQGRAMTQAGR